jgi:hypothetical protein
MAAGEQRSHHRPHLFTRLYERTTRVSINITITIVNATSTGTKKHHPIS